MDWPYHFIQLDAKQLIRRRQLLDDYGQLAQYSVIVPVSWIILTHFLQHVLTVLKSFSKGSTKRQSDKRSTSGDWPSIARSLFVVLGKLNWWFDDEIVQGWGTKKQWTIAGAWASWLLVLAVRDTSDDYLHLTKRFGIVGASQLPLHYLLSAKFPYNPLEYLTNLSHEERNPYHRLLGCMIIVLLCIHAALYMNFYFQLSLLSKRIRDSDVQLGLAAITSFLLIGTTTLSVIRNYSYRVFYIIHITFSCSILPILFFHVTHIRIYIIETTLIYLFVVLQRFFLVKRSRNAFLNKIPKTSLISISLGAPSTSATGKHDPGQHVYLSLPHNPSSPLNVFRKNPFTIANNPLKNDDRIYLVARQMSGMTRLLSELAHDFHRGPVDLIVERPKGASASFPDLLQYDRILFVAGGVGATYTIPIYRSLLRRVYSMHKKARSEPKKNMLRFVWSVRNPAETWWGINAVKEQYGKIPDGFELYVTSTQAEKLKEADRARNEDQEPIVKDITMSIGRGTDPSLAGILTEMADAIKPVDEDEMKKIIRRGRPDLKVLVDEIFGDNRVERVAVLVCGPVEMGRALRREVGKWVSRGKEVFWHDEQFWW